MEMKYKPLDPDTKEIRLLELLPQAHDKRRTLIPSCRILHVLLPDRPRFVTLSYVWGDVKDRRVILVDNSPVLVTQNLYNAMMALRPAEEPLVIWIDFLCINQADDDEKSWQVDMMKDIYRQASQVLAWLGPADAGSDSVIDHLNSFGAKAEACAIDNGVEFCKSVWRKLASEGPTSSAPKGPNLRVVSSSGSIVNVSRRDLNDIFYSLNGWNEHSTMVSISGLKSFLTRSWWGRIWVLQEIALPESAEFICGTKRITRRRCQAAINAYTAWWFVLMEQGANPQKPLTPYQLDAITQLSFHRPSVMLSAWKIYRYDKFPLAALLRATCVGTINHRRHGPHNIESTDPRDKIFALLGLAYDRVDLRRRGVFPDYSKSCRDVYTSAMAALIQQGHMSLLSFCQTPKKQPDLPSWVPDWSRSTTNMLQDVKNDHVTVYPKFAASGVEPHRSEVSFIKRNETIEGITLEGYIYDEIFDAAYFSGRSASNEVPVWETYSWPVKWLIEFLRLSYRKQRNYPSFEGRLNAVARSSIGDVGYGREKELARVGDDRFLDAAVLLKNGVKDIKESHIKRDVNQFLAKKSIKESLRGKNVEKIMLGSEIIGKSLGRLPFVTAKGHLLLSYEYVAKGDCVALVKGTQVPFILRRRNGSTYRLIGEAYVDGIMDGEAGENSKFGSIDLF